MEAIGEKLPGGHRPTYRHTVDGHSGQVCLKLDSGYPGCFFDKIAADFGQILDLPIPAALLIRRNGVNGMIQEMPGHSCPNTEVFLSVEAGPDAKAKLSNLYPHEIYAFDLWIENSDRHAANVLYAEELDSSASIWGIDHAHAFGCKGLPTTIWLKVGCSPIQQVQQPNFMTGVRWNKARMLGCCRSIELLADDIIDYVVGRAAAVYGGVVEQDIAPCVSKCLISRRSFVREWVERNIP